MHTTLMGDDLHFMGDKGIPRATNLSIVGSKKDVGMIDSVAKPFRKTADEQQSTGKSGRMTAEDTGWKIMAKFIERRVT